MRLSDWRNRLFPSPRWEEEVYWALDLETSGLRIGADAILSVGMVPIRNGLIRFGERFVSLVRPPLSEVLSTEGLRTHQLIPAEYGDAPPIGDILPEIDRRLRECILLVHHATLDVGFLKSAYRRLGRERPPLRVLDTIDLLISLHLRRYRFTPHPPAVRTGLADARRDLGLPDHTQHDALGDALATAELFLLLRQKLGIVRLRELPVRRR
jgi:DNA polymerase III subunit epsilon